MTIREATVIGAGTMGGGIAALFANAGIPVTLLDTTDDMAASGFERIKRASPSAFDSNEALTLVTIGSLDENLDAVRRADWIVEAIVERVEPKRDLLARVDAARRPGAIVSTNTSGLLIASLVADRSPDFAAHFLGTHFFNPPHVMRLVEVIPGAATRSDVVAFVSDFLRARFAKGVVLCKDSPNFIANRYGSITAAFAMGYALDHGYTVEETDAILGPLVGRPKTALYRLYDLVGLDVASDVSENLYDLIPDDETRDVLRNQRGLALRAAQRARGRLGNKSGAGFYKKPPPGEEGPILTLDLETLEYRPRIEPAIPSLAEAVAIPALADRLRFVLAQDDRAGALARHLVYHALGYAARRLPEIADDVASVDRAVRWGFSHEMGPFEIWDALGVRETARAMRDAGVAIAPWVDALLDAGTESFYRMESGEAYAYSPARGTFVREEPA